MQISVLTAALRKKIPAGISLQLTGMLRKHESRPRSVAFDLIGAEGLTQSTVLARGCRAKYLAGPCHMLRPHQAIELLARDKAEPNCLFAQRGAVGMSGLRNL